MSENAAPIADKAPSGLKHPKYWAHLLGIGLLATQNKVVLSGLGPDTDSIWYVCMATALIAGAVVAGIRHAVKKPSMQDTGKHFVLVAWVMCGLAVLQSHM